MVSYAKFKTDGIFRTKYGILHIAYFVFTKQVVNWAIAAGSSDVTSAVKAVAKGKSDMEN